MNDVVKMLGRYSVTAVVAYAVGKGWFTVEQASVVTQALIDIGVAILGVIPPLYAAFKINNSPA